MRTQSAPSRLFGSSRNALLIQAALLLLVSVPAAAEDEEWTVKWKNGTRIESTDGKHKIKFGGRIMADISIADADDDFAGVDITDGTELRRARLFVSGTVYRNVEFKINFDFAGSETDAKDVYAGIKNLPVVGGIRLGHQKEPYSFGEMNSSKYMPFIERSLDESAFAPSRNLGLVLHNSVANDRFTWAVGGFQDSDDRGRNVGSEWNLTGRFTGLLLDGSDDGPLLHAGLSVSSRSPEDDTVRYRTRPQSHLAPRLVDTSSLMASGVDLLGLEAVFTQGPAWISAEYNQADISSPTDGTLSGYNVQAGWYLTGERRPFKKSSAVWDRLKPKNPFLGSGGAGAWEIALRYTEIDLNDGLAAGGVQEGLTLAVNWYLNSATRLRFNFASNDVEGAGTVNFALLRLDFDF